MKIVVKLFISILFLNILIYSCDFADNRLKVVNKSKNGIYYRYRCDSNLGNNPIIVSKKYNIKGNDKKKYLHSNYFIPADSSRNVTIFGPRNGWIKYLNSCNNRIKIYIFSKEVIHNNEWDTIRQKRMISKSYDFSLSELRKNNWKVIYP